MSKMEIDEIRKGPWTDEEDALLVNYIAQHGEGHWNSLASAAGLRRTGKSCRLRWLNYLRPNVRRGNITLQEQLLILELHSRLGNRWSKIAEQLPGRTDNEIKNYWRTRVQKQAKQLKCDVDSQQFRDTMRYVWIPRLEEKIQSKKYGTSPGSSSSSASNQVSATITPNSVSYEKTEIFNSSTTTYDHMELDQFGQTRDSMMAWQQQQYADQMPGSSTSFETQVSLDSYHRTEGNDYDFNCTQNGPTSYFPGNIPQQFEHNYGDDGRILEKDEDIWYLLQHLNY